VPTFDAAFAAFNYVQQLAARLGAIKYIGALDPTASFFCLDTMAQPTGVASFDTGYSGRDDRGVDLRALKVMPRRHPC